MMPHPNLKKRKKKRKTTTDTQSCFSFFPVSCLWPDSKLSAVVPLLSHSIPNTQFSTCRDKQLAKGLREPVTEDA